MVSKEVEGRREELQKYLSSEFKTSAVITADEFHCYHFERNVLKRTCVALLLLDPPGPEAPPQEHELFQEMGNAINIIALIKLGTNEAGDNYYGAYVSKPGEDPLESLTNHPNSYMGVAGDHLLVLFPSYKMSDQLVKLALDEG